MKVLRFRFGKKASIELSIRQVIFIALGAVLLALILGYSISRLRSGATAIISLSNQSLF